MSYEQASKFLDYLPAKIRYLDTEVFSKLMAEQGVLRHSKHHTSKTNNTWKLRYIFSMPIMADTSEKDSKGQGSASKDSINTAEGKTDEKFDQFEFLTEVKIVYNRAPIQMVHQTFIVTKDFLPVYVKDPNSHGLISRHLLKLNSQLKYGSFSLDPLGCFKFQAMGVYEMNGAELMQNKDNIGKWFKINFGTTITTLRNYSGKLLRLAELITNDQYDVLTKGEKTNKMPSQFADIQNQILGILQNHINRIKTNKMSNVEETTKIATALKKEEYPEYFTTIDVKKVEYVKRLSAGGYADIHIVKMDYKINDELIKDHQLIAKVPKKDSTKTKMSHEIKTISDAEFVMKLSIEPSETV